MGIRFLPLKLDDLPQLAEWLRQPHVAAWWSAQPDPQALEAKYRPRIEGKVPISVFFIEVNGEPIGFIQADRFEQPKRCGVDIVLGKASLIGRGLGPMIIDQFVDGIVFGEYAVSSCFADPEVDHARSIRAFSKAGFIEVARLCKEGREHVLMERLHG